MISLAPMKPNQQPETAPHIVAQSNRLIGASYTLSLDEKRLLMICISRIDSRGAMPDKITISASAFAETYKLDINSTYRQIMDATDRLFEREVKFREGNTTTRMRWVDKVEYNQGAGSVTLSFTKHITPYLSQLSREYSPYKLANAADLKSFSAIRMYELLNQFISTGVRWISVEDLRNHFDMEDKYPAFCDFRRWVLDPSLKELNAKSNYSASYKTEKKGKAVKRVAFFVTEKPQMAMDL